MRRSQVLALLTALVTVTVVACTSDEPGQASASPGTVTTGTTEAGTGSSSAPYSPPVDPSAKTASPGTAIPTDSIKPRPRDLPLDDVKPCDLFTVGQMKQLKVTRTRPRISESEITRGMQQCPMDAEDGNTYVVTAMTREGIEAWLDGRRNVDAWLTSVGDYAAVNHKLFGGEGADCTTAVDLAEGQYLEVWMYPSSNREHSQDELCAMSERAAGMALQNLQKN